jgi:hypothetical protein
MTDFYHVRRQCAYNWGALPTYVFQDKDGNWRNFEHEMAYIRELVNPFTYYQKVNTDALVPLNLNIEQICLFYVIGNQHLHHFLKVQNGTLFQLQDIVKLDEETYMTLFRLWNRFDDPELYREMIQQVNTDKQTFRNEYERDLQEQEMIENLETVPFTDFEVDTVVRVYQLNSDIVFGNIYALFNAIRVSEAIPLVTTPRFYKVLKGYEYALELPEEEDTIYMFSTTGKVEIVQTQSETVEISFEYKQGEDDSSFLETICEAIGVSRENVSLKAERFNGFSFFPRQTISNIIWRDFVMNNSQASRLFTMDEHSLGIRTTKTSRQAIRRAFYVFYIEGEFKTKFTLKDNDGQGLKIRILNAISMERAVGLTLTLAKMFTLYNQLGSHIASEYNSIIGSNVVEFIPPNREEIIEDKPRLKNIASEMFLPNYTRKCGHLPDIVPNDQVEGFRKANVPIMRFPKEGDEIDGKFYHFVCNHHEDHIFPGLRKNPFENNTTFPLLPCCYQQNQATKRTSMYKEYFLSDKKLEDFKPREGDVVQNIQYRFLISDKFVGFEQTGKCSDIHENLFMLYTSVKPIRQGVHRTRKSALECILLATNYQEFNQLDSESRLRVIEQQIEILRSKDFTQCSQECWDVQDPKMFLDSDQYFDPKHMIRLLESTFNCRIVLLSRDDFIHPQHIQGYLRWKITNEAPIVILYEHYGSEADEATYPQCEWIRLLDTPEAQSVYEWIYRDYLNALETILPRQLPSETEFLQMFAPNYTPIEQHIDFYGKVYAFNVSTSTGKKLTLFLEDYRLPPFTNLPKATIGYYSNQLSTNLIGNRKQVQINDYDMYIYSQPPVNRILDQYETLRNQVELLIENARQLYAKRLLLGKDINDWSFIQVKPNAVIRYSKYLFSESEKVYVPNEDTKERVVFSLRLFATRFKMALMQYPELQDKIPFKYRSVHDFDVQSNAVILDSSSTIQWFSNFYETKPLDGTLYTQPFVAVLDGKPYKCSPIDKPSHSQYKVYFPQVQKIYIVGQRPRHNYLVLKNLKQIMKWYICESLKTTI